MKITDLSKSYEMAGRKLRVLEHLDMEPDDCGITVVLGRSGCGKTTLLRLVAGLEQADGGQIELDGGAGVSSGRPHGEKIKIGVIFQEPRLMPWLTVEDNILFGVKGKKRAETGSGQNAEDAGAGRLQSLLELTGLSGFEKAYPSQLSGGMQQRTALARALAYGADYILMDEPFAALDYFTRRQMQRELLRIQQAEKKGILFVTHSIDEALAIGTKIMVLEGGSCKREYDLRQYPYPRDMLSVDMIKIKRDIISQIEEQEEEKL